MGAFIRRCLIAGLLIWLPVLVTFFVLRFIIGLMDNVLALLPDRYQIPGFGVIIAILILFVTGLLVRNFIGRKLVVWWEYILHRIPIIRTIYSAAKQVFETVLVPNGQAFRQVVLVTFPHEHHWTLAFVVGQGLPEANRLLNQELLTVYVPTTPNPTSGYIILVPTESVKVLSMSVDDALKYVISLGVVQSKKIGV